MNMYRMVYTSSDGSENEVIVSAANRATAYAMFETLGIEDVIDIKCFCLTSIEETLNDKTDNKMVHFIITLVDDKVYVNGNLHECALPMDKSDAHDDLNKRAILALSQEMGYESRELFEEMTNRLDEMLTEME